MRRYCLSLIPAALALVIGVGGTAVKQVSVSQDVSVVQPIVGVESSSVEVVPA